MYPRRRFTCADLAALAALGALGLGCGGGDGPPDPPGLVTAARERPQPIDVARAAREPAELARALAQPHHVVAAGLGAHRFAGTSRVRVAEGDAEVELLEDQTRIELTAAGDYHAQLDNSREYGRDVYYVGGVMYLRPRYGKFHRRPPAEPGEPARVRDEIFATAGAYFELLAPGAELTDEGGLDHGGRRARKIEIHRAPAPAPRPREGAPERAWRQDADVRAVAGVVVLDEETGAVLDARLTGAVGVSREGRSFVMELAVTAAITDIGGAVAVTAPPAEQTVATPLRSREAEERERLLEGIAQPARPAPTPDNPGGGTK